MRSRDDGVRSRDDGTFISAQRGSGAGPRVEQRERGCFEGCFLREGMSVVEDRLSDGGGDLSLFLFKAGVRRPRSCSASLSQCMCACVRRYGRSHNGPRALIFPASRRHHANRSSAGTLFIMIGFIWTLAAKVQQVVVAT